MLFETWPEKRTNQFDPRFFFFFLIKPTGYGSAFLFGLKANFSGESGQEGNSWVPEEVEVKA